MDSTGTTLAYYDAHNHLQDERLAPHSAEIMADVAREGIRKMVVNGAAESDWDSVAALAVSHAQVIPSFGYHPWYVKERSPEWERHLTARLEQFPSAGVGEIGLDRWIKDYDLPDQEGVFVAQLRIAAEQNRPVSVHCLHAWGRLLEILKTEPRPARGFVLHSFGGPREMIDPLARLGGYFSLPGYFALERKKRQRDAFRHVPRERLLIETDAPDQCLPPERIKYPLTDPASGKPLNHPANLPAVYQFAAELLGPELPALARQVEENFLRLFSPPRSPAQPGTLPPMRTFP